MRLFISTTAALALCACALVACSPQDGSTPAAKSAPAANGTAAATQTTPQTATQKATEPATQKAGEARRISIEETQKAVADGEALIVDVRDEATYKTGHIKGAKSVPLSQFDERIGELPKDKLIITYCA
jgi:3-mercaptopyruvate sulfurtransferase SseA